MKINFIIPTRGHAARAAAVVQAFHQTASGAHDILYIVSYCADDTDTRDAMLRLARVLPVVPVCRTDHCTPAQAQNEAAEVRPADIYTGACDDTFPLTFCWDVLIVAAMAEHSLHMGCWIEAGDPNNTSYLFISGAMKAALGDRILPEYFPYWFCDLWLAEVHLFAFGHRPPLIQGLSLGGRRGTTQGHRDLPMWVELFIATRPERFVLAGQLAQAFPKMAKGSPKQAVQQLAAWDADMRKRAPEMAARFGDTKEPERYYIKAKERAEAMLNRQLTG